MSRFSACPPMAFKQGLWEESATQKHPLGTVRPTADGRLWVYSKASSTALAPGAFAVGISTFTTEDTVTVAHAIGVSTVTVTAASISANDFKDGYLWVDEGTGIGESYGVLSNTATAGGVITCELDHGLKTAWSASDTDVSVVASPYNTLVVNPVDGQQRPVVVPQYTITASYYFWGLARGFGTVLLDVNAAAGLELDEKVIEASVSHAGFGLIPAAPASQTANVYGKHGLGYTVEELDAGDNKAQLCYITLL